MHSKYNCHLPSLNRNLDEIVISVYRKTFSEEMAVLTQHTTAYPGVASLILARSLMFVEIVHEIISTVILLLPLIQEGLLSVSSESMCTKYWLTAETSFPRKKCGYVN